MRKLLPPKNFRGREKCCGTCKYFQIIDPGFTICERDPEHSCVNWDVGDEQHWLYVCDRYAN